MGKFLAPLFPRTLSSFPHPNLPGTADIFPPLPKLRLFFLDVLEGAYSPVATLNLFPSPPPRSRTSNGDVVSDGDNSFSSLCSWIPAFQREISPSSQDLMPYLLVTPCFLDIPLVHFFPPLVKNCSECFFLLELTIGQFPPASLSPLFFQPLAPRFSRPFVMSRLTPVWADLSCQSFNLLILLGKFLFNSCPNPNL